MREFTDIQQDLSLVPFLDSANGSLYYVPDYPDFPRLIVRRFDRDLAPGMIPTYVDILASAQRWIESNSQLAKLVRVVQPVEVGEDFIARPHCVGTSLYAFLDPDEEGDPPEPPDELAPMQAQFLAQPPSGGREELLREVLARSILEPTHKTLYSFAESRFIVVDLKLTRGELVSWRERFSSG